MKYLMKLESFTESKTYIKKYENIFQDNNLKKYFSWRLLDGITIFEVTGTHVNYNIDIKKIYKFDHINNTFDKIKTPTLLGLDKKHLEENKKIYMLYQSDNLKDCMEVTLSVLIGKNYNL